MNLLDKIIEELKQKAITKNIPYDAFIYHECIEILKNNKEMYKEQISDAWLDGYCANENDVIDSTNYFDTKFGHDVG